MSERIVMTVTVNISCRRTVPRMLSVSVFFSKAPDTFARSLKQCWALTESCTGICSCRRALVLAKGFTRHSHLA